jgi:hypothetical protein
LRTFPAELAEFRTIVKGRGERLRELPFNELKLLSNQAAEDIMVKSKKAKIGIIIRTLPSGGIQVVLQGSMEHRFLPGKSVALDGFYKYPDDTASAMKAEEFWEFD